MIRTPDLPYMTVSTLSFQTHTITSVVRPLRKPSSHSQTHTQNVHLCQIWSHSPSYSLCLEELTILLNLLILLSEIASTNTTPEFCQRLFRLVQCTPIVLKKKNTMFSRENNQRQLLKDGLFLLELFSRLATNWPTA